MRKLDLRCRRGHEHINVWVDSGPLPKCKCGAEQEWFIGEAYVVATDVYGQGQKSIVLGEEYVSRRELEKKMRRKGYIAAGDRVGGGPPSLPDPPKVPFRDRYARRESA